MFNNEGKLLRTFGEKGTGIGQILRGHGLGFDHKQRLFVTDVDNMRVNVYNLFGDFLYSWGKDGPNPGEFNAPHGLAIDRNGDIFIPGFYGPTQKFTARGNFLFAFAYADPPDNAVYFHALNGDRWGNVYIIGGTGGDYLGEGSKKVIIFKYNNNGDLIISWSLSHKEYEPSWLTVDKDDKVYVLYKGKTEFGVEIFEQQNIQSLKKIYNNNETKRFNLNL